MATPAPRSNKDEGQHGAVHGAAATTRGRHHHDGRHAPVQRQHQRQHDQPAEQDGKTFIKKILGGNKSFLWGH